MKLLSIVIIILQNHFLALKEIVNSFVEKHPEINVSIAIKNTENQQMVYSYQPAMSVHPASILKLLTTATALDQLGSDYRFSTYLYYSGYINSRTLYGSLHVKLAGDPAIHSHRIENNLSKKISTSLKQIGVDSLIGNVILEGNTNRFLPPSWPVGDVGNYYGAFPQDINYNHNAFKIILKSGSSEGEPTQIIDLQPSDTAWQIKNEITTGSKEIGDEALVYALPNQSLYLLRGRIPPKKSEYVIKGAIQNVKNILTQAIYSQLKNDSIVVTTNQTFDDHKLTLIESLESPPLYELIKITNFYSDNMFAEAIGYEIFKEENQYGAYVKKYWSDHGISTSSLQINDASGLSPTNYINASFMTNFLSYFTKDTDFYDFYSSIPVVGRQGSVANLDKRGLTLGKVRAKSGSIEGVRNYAGYVENTEGQKYAFMLATNGFTKEDTNDVKNFLESCLIALTYE